MTRAFTLIEIIIVIAISTLMLLALTLLIYTFGNTSTYEQASLQSSGSARAVIREAEALVLPADAVLQTYTFSSGATYTSTSTSLVLELPSIDSSGNSIPNAHDYAAFYVVGTDAYRLLQTDASSARTPGTKLLSTTIQSLTFTYNNADFTKVSSTTIDVQTQASVKQNVLTDHLREQLMLRNY
ncbi:MAG: hypothetical protein B7X03_00805 [Parcubacteria group bacterium 21-58-10]|nr:MAG: hypothetical protein B7X03_00805 [Parcubacteria group bacterium 21-58-10]